MAVHVAAIAGVDLPTAVGWVVFLGIFPPFFAAVFTHPRAIVRGANARLGPLDGMVGAFPPYVVLAVGSIIYMFVVGARLGVHHVEMDHHLTLAEMQGLSALAAAFFAMSCVIQSSACAREDAALGP